MEIYNRRAISFIPNFNRYLNLKYIVALTLNNMSAGPYLVLKYFSFTITKYLAYSDIRL